MLAVRLGQLPGGAGGHMTKIVALALVIGVLVAGSAIFAKNHPQAIAACFSGCDQ